MSKVKLKPGDPVYCVVENSSPEGETTWRIERANVVTASDRQISLLGASALGLHGKRFPASALGVLFHATREGALAHFEKSQQLLIERAQSAQRALAWIERCRKFAPAEEVVRVEQGGSKR